MDKNMRKNSIKDAPHSTNATDHISVLRKKRLKLDINKCHNTTTSGSSNKNNNTQKQQIPQRQCIYEDNVCKNEKNANIIIQNNNNTLNEKVNAENKVIGKNVDELCTHKVNNVFTGKQINGGQNKRENLNSFRCDYPSFRDINLNLEDRNKLEKNHKLYSEIVSGQFQSNYKPAKCGINIEMATVKNHSSTPNTSLNPVKSNYFDNHNLNTQNGSQNSSDLTRLLENFKSLTTAQKLSKKSLKQNIFFDPTLETNYLNLKPPERPSSVPPHLMCRNFSETPPESHFKNDCRKNGFKHTECNMAAVLNIANDPATSCKCKKTDGPKAQGDNAHNPSVTLVSNDTNNFEDGLFFRNSKFEFSYHSLPKVFSQKSEEGKPANLATVLEEEQKNRQGGYVESFKSPMPSRKLRSYIPMLRGNSYDYDFSDTVHASEISLESDITNSVSMEERNLQEIKILKRELENAHDKINTLTSQLKTNAYVVSAFEESMSEMTMRLHKISQTVKIKDIEIDDLRRASKKSTNIPNAVNQTSLDENQFKEYDIDSISNLGSLSLERKKKRINWSKIGMSVRKVFSPSRKLSTESVNSTSDNSHFQLSPVIGYRVPLSVPSTPLVHCRRNFIDDNASLREKELISLLREQLHEKDMLLTELRLESLSTTHQLEQFKDAINILKTDLDRERVENEKIIRNMAYRRISVDSSQPDLLARVDRCRNGNHENIRFRRSSGSHIYTDSS